MDKSIKKTSSIYTIIVCMVILAGCAPRHHSGQAKPSQIEPVCAAGVSEAEAMSATEAVLGQMHFAIEKADAKAGYIRTRPLAAGQWFEFWREDNVGEFNKAEANLHTVRRIAEVEISKQDGKVCVSCEVTAQKLSLSDREIHGTSSARDLFAKNKGSLQRLELNPDQKKAWSDLGEDDLLSNLILKRIEEKLKESK